MHIGTKTEKDYGCKEIFHKINALISNIEPFYD